MPSVLALINIKFLTPMTSVIFMSVATLICLFINNTILLIKMSSLAEYLFIALSVAGLLWLRRSQPKRDRPIKVSRKLEDSFLFGKFFTN